MLARMHILSLPIHHDHSTPQRTMRLAHILLLGIVALQILFVTMGVYHCEPSCGKFSSERALSVHQKKCTTAVDADKHASIAQQARFAEKKKSRLEVMALKEAKDDVGCFTVVLQNIQFCM